MKKISFPARVLMFIVRIYQNYVSPMTGPHCRYRPTCSEYAMQAIRMHGAFRGSIYAIWRILRCNPFSKGGYDPVPPKKGE